MTLVDRHRFCLMSNLDPLPFRLTCASRLVHAYIGIGMVSVHDMANHGYAESVQSSPA